MASSPDSSTLPSFASLSNQNFKKTFDIHKVDLLALTDASLKNTDFGKKDLLSLKQITMEEVQNILRLNLGIPDAQSFVDYIVNSIHRGTDVERKGECAQKLLENPTIRKAFAKHLRIPEAIGQKRGRPMDENVDPSHEKKRRMLRNVLPRHVSREVFRATQLKQPNASTDRIKGDSKTFSHEQIEDSDSSSKYNRQVVQQAMEKQHREIKSLITQGCKKLGQDPHDSMSDQGLDHLLDQAWGALQKSKNNYATRNDSRISQAPFISSDPMIDKIGDDLTVEDISTLDIKQPGAHDSVFDLLGRCGGNLIALVLEMMFGNGSFKGIYYLNQQKLAEEADKTEVALQDLTNLKECMDSLNSDNSSYWSGSENKTFTVETIVNGHVQTIQKTMTVAAYLADQNPPITLRTSGGDTTMRDANIQNVSQAEQLANTKQNQQQNKMNQAQQTENTNLQTVKQLIQYDVQVLQNTIPKPI